MHNPQTQQEVVSGRREQFLMLLKISGLVILTTLIIIVFAPNEMKFAIFSVNITSVSVIFMMRTIYIYASAHHQQRFKAICKIITDTYQVLTVEQKLYTNSILILLFSVFFCAVGGRVLRFPMFVLILAFFGYIALRDVLRWYRMLSEHPLGKAAIAIGFAIASNLAYALANQLVSQAVHVTPTSFLRTTLFIAILMIPVLMVFAGGIAFAIGSAVSSLVIFLSMGPELDRFRNWLLAGTWPTQTIRFAFATRFFQLLFYLGILSTLSILGGRHFIGYEKVVSGWIPGLIYNLDMYGANECQLGDKFKIAPIGDSKFLIAQQTASGISFQPPVKCDDLPSPKVPATEPDSR